MSEIRHARIAANKAQSECESLRMSSLTEKNKKQIYRMRCDESTLFACKQEIDSDKSPRIVEGYLSTFGMANNDRDVDSDRDVIVKGAYNKTISDNFGQDKNGIPFLVLHAAYGGDTKETVGTIFEAKEDDHGLFVRIRMASTQAGKDAFILIAEGHIRGMSIGYRAIRWKYFEGEDGKTCCNLLEIALLEGTLTGFPADPRAEITNFKTEALDKVNSRLAKLEETMKGRESKSEAADTDKPEEGKAAVRTPDETHLDYSHLDDFILKSKVVIERSKDHDACRKDGSPPG